MEHSINLEYLRQITFSDPELLKEMLEEWKEDTRLRLEEFKDCGRDSDAPRLFKMVHTLKTNFFMIGCKEMIKCCEDFINGNKNVENSIAFETKANKAYLEICLQLTTKA